MQVFQNIFISDSLSGEFQSFLVFPEWFPIYGQINRIYSNTLKFQCAWRHKCVVECLAAIQDFLSLIPSTAKNKETNTQTNFGSSLKQTKTYVLKLCKAQNAAIIEMFRFFFSLQSQIYSTQVLNISKLIVFDRCTF